MLQSISTESTQTEVADISNKHSLILEDVPRETLAYFDPCIGRI